MKIRVLNARDGRGKQFDVILEEEKTKKKTTENTNL